MEHFSELLEGDRGAVNMVLEEREIEERLLEGIMEEEIRRAIVD